MTDKERKDLKQRLDKMLEPYETQAKAVKSKGEKSSKGFSAALSTVGMVGALTMPLFEPPAEAGLIFNAGTLPLGVFSTSLGNSRGDSYDIDGVAGYEVVLHISNAVYYPPQQITDYSASIAVTSNNGLGFNKTSIQAASASATAEGFPTTGGVYTITTIANHIHHTTGTGSTFPVYHWPPGQRGYVAIKFERGGNKHLGFIDMTLDAGAGRPNTIEIHNYAYNDVPIGDASGDGDSIHFERPIPEPGTLATLALGVAGLLAWRRHRQKMAEKAKQEATTTDDKDLMMS